MQNQSWKEKIIFSEWKVKQKMFLQAGNFRSGAQKPWGAKEEEEEEVGVNIAQQPFERLWVCQKIHTFASYAVLPTLAPCDPPRIKGQKSPKLIVSNWGLKSHL